MKVINFRTKFLITIIPLMGLIGWNISQGNKTLCIKYSIGFTIIVISQLGLYAITNKKSDDESIIATVAFYLGTAIVAIIMYNTSAGILWIVLPFLYISETIVRNDNIIINNGQKMALFISAIIMYAIRIIVTHLNAENDSIADAIMYFSALIMIFTVIQNIAKGKEYLDYTLNKSQDDSFRDGLTNLYNRAALNKKLNRSFKNIGGVAVIMMDIDNFKKVNDTYGHVFGDTVLKNLSRILQSIENSKIKSYRYGGEEFTIVCTSMKEEEVFLLAEKVRNEFKKIVYILNDEEKYFTLSLGMVCSNYKDYTSVEKIIKDSDAALYEAKESGKNRVKKFTRKEKDN